MYRFHPKINLNVKANTMYQWVAYDATIAAEEGKDAAGWSHG